MNPLTNVKNIQKLNQRELELGVIGKKSWHDEYKDSAWLFIGGLPYDLTEGDIICIFSQYGEVVNINLVRDKATGKSKGFAFLCYEDQRSTVLAVDNLNSIKIVGRIIRVDHVANYKKPKETGEEDELTKQLRTEGCAPKLPPSQPMAAQLPLLEEPPTIRPPPSAFKSKKAKKDKKKKKKKKKKMKVTVKVEHNHDSDTTTSSSSSSSTSSSESSDSDDDERRHNKSALRRSELSHKKLEAMKRERDDPGYDRAVYGHGIRLKEEEDDHPARRDRKSSRREGRDDSLKDCESGRGRRDRDGEEAYRQVRRDDRRDDGREDGRREVKHEKSDRDKSQKSRDNGGDRDNDRGRSGYKDDRKNKRW